MTFHGFDQDAVDFFTRLADDNSREFFTANRATYDRAIRQPLEDLLVEAEAAYGPGRVMRPNRDVRFSTDKSPYRLEGSLWAGNVGGVYLSVSVRGIEAGGGLYDPTRDQLERARAAIAEQPRAAAELRAAKAELEAAGFEMAGPSLKTAPRGIDRDHPEIDLLRLKHYAALTRLPIGADPRAVRDAWARVGPLIAWSTERAGAALSWP